MEPTVRSVIWVWKFPSYSCNFCIGSFTLDIAIFACWTRSWVSWSPKNHVIWKHIRNYIETFSHLSTSSANRRTLSMNDKINCKKSKVTIRDDVTVIDCFLSSGAQFQRQKSFSIQKISFFCSFMELPIECNVAPTCMKMNYEESLLQKLLISRWS